ncbi:MAG: hypothetical protein MR374_05335 [Clostridia bacterium]|nr:hypothetical protein [Clostridia bacterium]
MKKIAAFLCSLLLLFAAGCQAAAAPDSPSEPDGQSELSSESGSVIDTADPDAAPQETARPDSPLVTQPWNFGWNMAVSSTPGLPFHLEGGETVTYTARDENGWVYARDESGQLVPCTPDVSVPAGETLYWIPYYDDSWEPEFNNSGSPCWIHIAQYTDGHLTALVLAAAVPEGEPGGETAWYSWVETSVTFPAAGAAPQEVGKNWADNWYKEQEEKYPGALTHEGDPAETPLHFTEDGTWTLTAVEEDTQDEKRYAAGETPGVLFTLEDIGQTQWEISGGVSLYQDGEWQDGEPFGDPMGAVFLFPAGQTLCWHPSVESPYPASSLSYGQMRITAREGDRILAYLEVEMTPALSEDEQELTITATISRYTVYEYES